MHRTRWWKVVGAWILVLAFGVQPNTALARPAFAWPVCNAGHPASHQFTAQEYNAIGGKFYTFQPNVPSLTSQFSVSHLYPFRGTNYIPFVEVGWYKGVGTEKIAANSSYYTAMREVGGLYIEHDFQDAPSGVPIEYRLVNVGFNDGTAKWMWWAYADNLQNPLYPWEIGSINWARGLSGGETNGPGIEMHVWMQPTHQLRLPTDGQWHIWNQDLMTLNNDGTTSCADPGLNLGYNVFFDNYVITGTTQ
jgi:hypothetical protein